MQLVDGVRVVAVHGVAGASSSQSEGQSCCRLRGPTRSHSVNDARTKLSTPWRAWND